MATHFPQMAGKDEPAPATPLPMPDSTVTWQFAHLIRKPGDPIVRQRFEFKGLSQKVRDFLVNQIGTSSRDDTARLLWLQGRPGEGKSEGCLVACLNAGFHVAILSPGLFAGDVEGASVQALHAVLAELVRWSTIHRCRIVVIVDDFDLSTANVSENQGSTINSQLLVNEVMSLADKRHLYRNADGSNIGLIFTVNDATGMRESLTRSGRSEIYDHVPTFEDKANIAWAVLDPKTSAERDLVHALVRKYARRQPVSFWKALYFRMRSMHAHNLTQGGMPDKATIDRVNGYRLPLNPDIAWEAARQMRASRIKRYLSKSTWWRHS